METPEVILNRAPAVLLKRITPEALWFRAIFNREGIWPKEA